MAYASSGFWSRSWDSGISHNQFATKPNSPPLSRSKQFLESTPSHESKTISKATWGRFDGYGVSIVMRVLTGQKMLGRSGTEAISGNLVTSRRHLPLYLFS